MPSLRHFLHAMLRFARTFPIVLGASLLALPMSLTFAKQSVGYAAVLATLTTAGYQSVEELETTAHGGYEAEVFDAKQQAFEVLIDSAGAIKTQRLEAQSSSEERIEIDVMKRVVAWLDTQGYRNTSSIAADDGHIEIETEDAKGAIVELDLDATPDSFRVLRARSHSRFTEKVKELVD